jgi:hypothetical protein
MGHHPSMALDADPYRTLGLARGASLDEVKRAYRRLAKANHPDAAGESALPRFLAIQAAYDQIVGPGASRTTGARRAAARRPWEADPSRADATRRAYGNRARRTRDRPRTEEPPGSGAGPARAEPRDTRPKRATLGSTSYDGADAEPFEPDWGGASWYGTTSGTYWTLNPKEYADPRKHGPEYQARGRRARPDVDPDTAPRAMPAPGVDADAGAGGEPDPRPSHTTSSWWEATTGDAAAGGPATDEDGPHGGDDQAPRRAGARHGSAWRDHRPAAAAGAGPSIGLDGADWLDPGRFGLAGRVGRAAVGWVPIALGIGWLAGEITGCGRFAATCDAGTAPVAWFAQVAVLAVLLIVPGLARVTTIAAIATLAAAVAGALLLSATGGGDGAATDIGRAALGGLLVIAWLGGVGLGIVRELRGRRPPPTAARGAGPVS